MPFGKAKPTRNLCRHFGLGVPQVAPNKPSHVYLPSRSLAAETRPVSTSSFLRYVPTRLALNVPSPPNLCEYDAFTSTPEVVRPPTLIVSSCMKALGSSQSEP